MIVIMYDDFVDQLIAKSSKARSIDEGTYLFRQDDRVTSVFLIEEGLVELVRHQQDGTIIVLQRAKPHSILAEASIYSGGYHCGAIAKQPSKVLILSKSAFLKFLQQDDNLSHSWAARLAREVQSARSQIEILSRKTVSERLDGWLAWQDHELPSKGQWKSIAEQIGVSPEALYRELAKRRQANQSCTACVM